MGIREEVMLLYDKYTQDQATYIDTSSLMKTLIQLIEENAPEEEILAAIAAGVDES